MILKNLRLFSQNVWKKKSLTDIILETRKEFDIIFIQKPLLLFICTILSSSNKKEDRVVRAPNYPNWLTFSKSSTDNNNHTRVISYINTWLFYIHFSLRKDIFDHKDINCFSFFNNDDIFFMVNAYSYDYQSALKYLKNTEATLYNVLVMASNFNIRDRN